MLEKEIEAKVCDYAKEKGMLVYKFSSPNHVGVPDRLFLMPLGKAFFIEFKAKGGKATPMQIREGERMKEKHFHVYLIDSMEAGKEVIDAEWEMVEATLEAFAAFVAQTAIEEAEHASKH